MIKRNLRKLNQKRQLKKYKRKNLILRVLSKRLQKIRKNQNKTEYVYLYLSKQTFTF